MARDPYEVVLADLRAKRDEIDKLILSLEAFRPAPTIALGTPAPTTPPPAPPVPMGRLFGASILDASAAVIRDKGAPMSNGDIAEAIQAGGLVMNSAEPANTVSSVLHRAWESGSDVVRVGRGMWGLKEWYPGRDMSKPLPKPRTVEEQAAQALLKAGWTASDFALPEPDEEDDPVDPLA